jgi:hypothetical protein
VAFTGQVAVTLRESERRQTVDDAVHRQVGAGQHSDDIRERERRRRVDRTHGSRGKRRAHEECVQCARAGEIVGELTVAGGEAVIFAPCRGRIVWGLDHCLELLGSDAILGGNGRGRECDPPRRLLLAESGHQQVRTEPHFCIAHAPHTLLLRLASQITARLRQSSRNGGSAGVCARSFIVMAHIVRYAGALLMRRWASLAESRLWIRDWGNTPTPMFAAISGQHGSGI